MNRMFVAIIVLIMEFGVVSSSLLAESHSFELLTEATLGGTSLIPGKYKMVLNGDEAELYRNGKLVAKAKFELQPLEEGVQPNTKKIENGEIHEIRLKKEVVVFSS